MENIRVVFISVPRDEVKKFARAIEAERLAACVNIVPHIDSFFWWNNEVQSDEEALMIIKTTQARVDRLIEYVRENHPYDIPEIITVPVAEGLPDYINWVIEETGKS